MKNIWPVAQLIGLSFCDRLNRTKGRAEQPQIKAAMQHFMAQHFQHWVSESIPALDGRTSLEAVRDPEGREKVLALVLDAERRARKMTPPVDDAVLQRVRERLGLPTET